MIKKMNTMFFGTCFLAALMAEAYCMQVLKGDLFSTIGIGIVVLITGYLFMDSIKSKIVKSGENARFYLDHSFKEETEKWNERYTELVNLQKAIYTATKKNSAMLEQQLGEVLAKLENIENNNEKDLKRMIDLQMKSMEGQKNALNLEIHYNKENTKQLISILQEEGRKPDVNNQLSRILELLENNNELLKVQSAIIEKANTGSQDLSIQKQPVDSSLPNTSENNFVLEPYEYNFIPESSKDNFVPEPSETNIDQESSESNFVLEPLENNYIQESSENKFVSEPLENNYIQEFSENNFVSEPLENNYIQESSESKFVSEPSENNYIQESSESNFVSEASENNYVQEASKNNFMSDPLENSILREQDLLTEYMPKVDVKSNNKKAPEFINSIHEEQEPEAANTNLENEMNNTPVVTPLYADPNKNLTADEIAALFASVGK